MNTTYMKKILFTVLGAIGAVFLICVVAVLIVFATGKPLFRGFVTDIWFPWSPWWPRTLIIGDKDLITNWKVEDFVANEYPQPPAGVSALQMFNGQVTAISPDKMQLNVAKNPGINIAIDVSVAKFAVYDPVKKGPKSLVPFTSESFQKLKPGQIIYIEGRQQLTGYNGLRANLVMIQEE